MLNVLPLLCLFACPARAATVPFVITVVDDQTGRGVPLVELTTVNNVRFVTDSAGLAAIDDVDLLDRKIFFIVTSHGYEFPKDGFGIHGLALDLKPGDAATLKIRRLNIAQRLYRTTGGGIYRDTVMAGRTAPIKESLLNAQVFGQDSVQRVIYHGQIHWFWGDTNRASYPLGHFGMSGAVSDLPDHGGLDPSVGIDYTYFTDPTGFARPMVPGQNLRWIDGLVVLKDDKGHDRLLAKCEMLKSLSQSLGRKLIVYNDDKNAFDDLAPLDRNEPLCPQGPSLRHTDDGVEYVYFANPFATLRVRADWKAIQTPSEYEGFTCLASGTRYSKTNPPIERDAAGNPVWAWKKNTPPINSRQQADLVKAGVLKPDQTWNDPRSADGKEMVFAHAGSVAWNDYRKKWVAIFCQQGGKSSLLGEIWYAEADQPYGPFRRATKVVTHDHYTFYNPVHHPFFDQDGGRAIYFEGTYCNTFSGNPQQTPRYDYNQIMYKLDLSDPRLTAPAP